MKKTRKYKYMVGAKDQSGIVRAYAIGNDLESTKRYCYKMLLQYLDSKKDLPYWLGNKPIDDFTIEVLDDGTNNCKLAIVD